MPKQRRSKSRSKSASNSELNPKYTGPMTLSGDKDQNRVTRVRMTFATALQSSAGGVISGLIPNNPSTWTDWSNYASQYEVFRVLAMRVHFIPIQHYFEQIPIAMNGVFPGVIVTTNRRLAGVAVVSTSYPQEYDYESSIAHNLDQPFTMDWRAAGAAEFVWSATSTGGTTGNVGYYADSLSATTNYTRVFIEAIVEFTGRV